MAIDPRSALGRNLDVGTPLTFDLRQLSEASADQLAKRMGPDVSREEALLRMLTLAGKLMMDDVISIDTATVFAAHSEVQTAVYKIQDEGIASGKPVSRGRALTKLLVIGSRAVMEPDEKQTDKKDDWFPDLFRGFGFDGLFGKK